MKLSEVQKAAIEGDKVKLKGLTLAVYQFLTDEKSKEEIVEELSDEDINENEFQDLFGPASEELITELVIEQANFYMANWIVNNPDASDFAKEEIAYAFTQEYSLSDEDDDSADLVFSLYTQGFLTGKEQGQILSKLSQKTLLRLAVHYNEDSSIATIVDKLDNLHLSMFLQHAQVRTLSKEVYELLKDKNKVYGKNAISVLGKIKNSKDHNWLIEQALLENDPEIAYFILIQYEVQDPILLQQIIKSALKSMFFNYTSLSARLMVDVDEYIVSTHQYHIEKLENGDKKMVFNGRELASYNASTDTIEKNPYFRREVTKIIKDQLTKNSSEIPEVVKGLYSFQDETFYPYDKALSLEGIKYQIHMESGLYLDEAIKLWKPNVQVPAVLTKIESKYKLEVFPSQVELQVQPWQAFKLTELRKKISERINFLQNSLKLNTMNPNRPFGVEIELCMKGVRPSDLALHLDGDDLYDENELAPVNSSRKSAISNWAVKFDASVKHLGSDNKPLKEMNHLEQNRFTAEIITPKLYGEEGLSEIRNKLNSLLQEYGDYLSVNYTCGLHVHHDMNELFVFNPATNRQELNDHWSNLLKEELGKVQESIYSLCAPERRNNMYCPRFDVKNGVHSPKIVYSDNGRGGVNRPRPGFNMATGYGTIEFRMHEATLDVEQIINWIKITHHLVDEAINKVIAVKNQAVEQLQETLKLMEIEKLKKVKNEEDLELALAEINEFIKNNQWSSLFINS